MVPVAQIPTSAEEVAKNCNQIKKVAVSQGDVSRPIWFAAVGLTTFCVEGIQVAERWTEKRGETGHSDTDYQTRYNSWDANPPSCAKFEADNPKGCAGCLHKGKINTPLVLGRASQAIQATTEAEQSIEAVERPPLFLPDKNGNGRPLGTTANVKAVLEYEDVTARYNQMTKELEVIVPGVNSVPDESSNSNQTAALDLLTKHGVPYARGPEQINVIAASNPYCPVRQMIESKPWDGSPRFELFAAQITTPHPIEARDYLRKWLIQAVAAVYLMEGLSAAGMLVLAGPQGIGKTMLIRILASAVADSFLEGATLDPSNKDSVMTIASHWIVELGELDATFRKSDLAQLKAFITKRLDKFRRPYAKKDSEFPRHTVMAGTVNEAEFLYDTTGNRRFWVIQVNAINIDHSIDIQQLWAEAKTLYDAGETWHFNQQEQASLNQHNSQFEVVDPVAEKIMSKFDFQNMAKTTWLTATRIAELALFDRPTKGEVQRVSTVVRGLNGNQAKRVGGNRLLCVPGVHL
jgi:putative DNA primase/helicase